NCSQRTAACTHAKHRVMYCRQKAFNTRAARRMYAKKVTRADKNGGFVHYHPIFYPVTEVFGANRNKLCKPVDDLAICPATLIFERLGEVPVVKGYPGLNALLQAIVDNFIVMIDTGLIDAANALRQNTRPGYGETKVG